MRANAGKQDLGLIHGLMGAVETLAGSPLEPGHPRRHKVPMIG
jgi:hypothetical protein